MSTKEIKAISRRFYEEFHNKGNLHYIHEVFAPTFAERTADDGGVEAFKKSTASIRAAFPDYRMTLDDQIAEGDKLVNRWTFTGTHQGEYLGVPPTGKTAVGTGISFTRYAGGKLVEAWNHADGLGTMQQLGLVPSEREDYGWGEPSSVTGDPGDPEENKASNRRFFEEAWNKGNLDVIDEVYAAEWARHDPFPPRIQNREGWKQGVADARAAFPDLHFATEDVIAEGDKVVARYTFSGTHRGEFMGAAPTGKLVKFSGISIVRYADGQIVEVWSGNDYLGWMQQVGLIPSLEGG